MNIFIGCVQGQPVNKTVFLNTLMRHGVVPDSALSLWEALTDAQWDGEGDELDFTITEFVADQFMHDMRDCVAYFVPEEQYEYSKHIRVRVGEALSALGSSDMQVAVVLAKNGISGAQALCDVCPVAEYIRHIDPTFHPTVTRRYITVNGVTMDTPKGVREFIGRFDKGDFPQLIKTSE